MNSSKPLFKVSLIILSSFFVAACGDDVRVKQHEIRAPKAAPISQKKRTAQPKTIVQEEPSPIEQISNLPNAPVPVAKPKAAAPAYRPFEIWALTPDGQIEEAYKNFTAEEVKQNPFQSVMLSSHQTVNGLTTSQTSLPEKEKEKKRAWLMEYVLGLLAVNKSPEEALQVIEKFEKVLLEERGGQPLNYSVVNFSGETDNHEMIAERLLVAKGYFENQISHPQLPVTYWNSYDNPIGFGGHPDHQSSIRDLICAREERRVIYTLDKDPGNVGQYLIARSEVSNRWKTPENRDYYVIPQIIAKDYSVGPADTDGKKSQKVSLLVRPTAGFAKAELTKIVKSADDKANDLERESLKGRWHDSEISKIYLTLPEPGGWMGDLAVPYFDPDKNVELITKSGQKLRAIEGKAHTLADGSIQFDFEFKSGVTYYEHPNCQGECYPEILVVFNEIEGDVNVREYLNRDLALQELFPQQD